MRKYIYVSLGTALLIVASAYAGSFTNDFSNPTPAGFMLNGGSRPSGDPYPAIENGYLALTYAENSEQGTIVLDELDPGATIASFTANFKVRIGGGSSTPADGIAFFFGSDLDIMGTFGEEGPTTAAGITVCFDTYDNVDGDPMNGIGEAPAIDVKVNGVEITHKMLDVFFMLSDTFTNVVIQLNGNGTMNVVFKNTVIYTNLYLTGYTPITSGRFAIGARTGGLNENNWIDDLSITTVVAGAPTAPTFITQPQSQTVQEGSPVTFSILPGGTPPFTFQWLKDNVAIADATNLSYTISSAPFSANGAKFKARVSNSVGSIDSDEAILTVIQDTNAPTIVSAQGSDTFNTVTVVFSEAVTAASAGSAGNYKADKGLNITSATIINSTTVRLGTSPQTPGEVYTLTVNGINDTASVPNPIAANSTIAFSAWAVSAGGLKFETWSGLDTGDNNLDNTLLADPRYPNSPDFVARTSAFDSRPAYPNDSHEGYGGKMSGWLTPPETANYRFFIYSDDSSRLFISTDDKPANLGATPIAEETGCCNIFTEPPSPRTSEPIRLTAGQKYYVQVIWKEGTGGDYCQVAWRKEGDSTPAGSLRPIPGNFLSSYGDPGVANVQITQQPGNTGTTENKTATFSVAATGAPAPVFYQWQRAEPGTTTFLDIPWATGASYTTPALKRATDNGAKYRAVAFVFGKSATSTEATLTVEVDLTPPALVNAIPGENFKSVRLVFSEAMDPVSAAVAGNYTIPGLTVSGAKLLAPNTVQLTTSQQAEKTTYTVTVNANVKDTAIPPNGIDPAANSKSFVSLTYLPGVMKFEAFTGISGTAVTDLTGSAKYPNSPDEVRLVPGYEGPSGYGDNYGARVSGFIAPKTTGNYIFYMASDDLGELWLSTDDDPANKVKIAYEPGWASSREYTGDAGGRRPNCAIGACENVSQPIRLEAGKRYYSELLYKEGGGGDNGAVAMKLETDPDPENGSAPVGGDLVGTAIAPAVLQSISLPVDLASPIGSGDVSKAGFTARVWQANQDTGGTTLYNSASRAEQQLAGAVVSKTAPGVAGLGNFADLSAAVNGVFPISTYINWNQEAGPGGDGTEFGNFQSTSTPSRPDQRIPGIPGTGSTTGRVTDNIAAEVITYVEFPQPGLYFMGVNSDDGFRVAATDQTPVNNQAVVVQAPPSVAGAYYNVDGSRGGGFKPITGTVSGKLVAASPYEACSDLTNPDALKGNIALITRGVCEFSSKVQRARQAGAIAAIVVNSRDIDSGDGMWPIVMGIGSAGYQDIPAVMITKPDGLKLKAALDAGENITVSITADTTPVVGQFDGERGAADSVFVLNVAQAGVYPFRCVWWEGGGGANLEWFTVTMDGEKILLNDTSNPKALKAYRTRTYAPPVTPAISVERSGLNIVLTFKGVLQAADKVDGPYADVTGATSPATIPASGSMKFYRARR
jgi:hypothetical protein